MHDLKKLRKWYESHHELADVSSWWETFGQLLEMAENLKKERDEALKMYQSVLDPLAASQKRIVELERQVRELKGQRNGKDR